MARPARIPVIKQHHMANKPILVAMISVYNSSKWLRNRFNNLMQTKTYQQGKLLIYATNANSPDNEDETICKEYIKSPNVIYDRIGTCTVYGAWNHIIKNTNTQFITNANSDDLIAPNAYEILLEACINQNAPLSYCGWYTIGDQHGHWQNLGSDKLNSVGHYDPTRDQISCGHFPLWRREMHDKIGLFDPQFKALGDADFWIRAWRNDIRGFAPINLPLGGYRWRFGDNLWDRTDESQRTREWSIVHSRTAGKLEF